MCGVSLIYGQLCDNSKGYVCIEVEWMLTLMTGFRQTPTLESTDALIYLRNLTLPMFTFPGQSHVSHYLTT